MFTFRRHGNSSMNEQTQQNLRELIDEVTYLERQVQHRDMVIQQLREKEQLAAKRSKSRRDSSRSSNSGQNLAAENAVRLEAKEMSNVPSESQQQLQEALTSLLRYITLLERSILAPAVVEFRNIIVNSRLKQLTVTQTELTSKAGNPVLVSLLEARDQVVESTSRLPMSNNALDAASQTGSKLAVLLHGFRSPLADNHDPMLEITMESFWKYPAFQLDEIYMTLAMLSVYREQLEKHLSEALDTVPTTWDAQSTSASTSLLLRTLKHVQHERAEAENRIEQLERKLSEDRSSVSNGFEALKKALAQSNEDTNRLKMENVAQREKIESLQFELEGLHNQLKNSNSTRSLPRKECVDLSAHTSAICGDIPMQSSIAQEHAQVYVPPDFTTQTTAFEMTISALNEELSNMEAKMLTIEEERLIQCSTLRDEINGLKEQYQNERKECDAFVQKMMDEMELLWAENEELRQQIMSQATGLRKKTNTSPTRRTSKEGYLEDGCSVRMKKKLSVKKVEPKTLTARANPSFRTKSVGKRNAVELSSCESSMILDEAHADSKVTDENSLEAVSAAPEKCATSDPSQIKSRSTWNSKKEWNSVIRAYVKDRL